MAFPQSLSAHSSVESGSDTDAILLAKAYLDDREFMRAAHILATHFRLGDGSHRLQKPKNTTVYLRARFIRWYALFLVSIEPGMVYIALVGTLRSVLHLTWFELYLSFSSVCRMVKGGRRLKGEPMRQHR